MQGTTSKTKTQPARNKAADETSSTGNAEIPFSACVGVSACVDPVRVEKCVDFHVLVTVFLAKQSSGISDGPTDAVALRPTPAT